MVYGLYPRVKLTSQNPSPRIREGRRSRAADAGYAPRARAGLQLLLLLVLEGELPLKLWNDSARKNLEMTYFLFFFTFSEFSIFHRAIVPKFFKDLSELCAQLVRHKLILVCDV